MSVDSSPPGPQRTWQEKAEDEKARADRLAEDLRFANQKLSETSRLVFELTGNHATAREELALVRQFAKLPANVPIEDVLRVLRNAATPTLVIEELEPLRELVGAPVGDVRMIAAKARALLLEAHRASEGPTRELAQMVKELGDLGGLLAPRSSANVTSRILAMVREYRATLAAHAVALHGIGKLVGLPATATPEAVEQAVTAALKGRPAPSAKVSPVHPVVEGLTKLSTLLEDAEKWMAAHVKDNTK